MATFHLELVSPERLLFEGQVESVQLPASEGDMTILPGHSPVITTLKPGILTVSGGTGGAQRLFVRGGFADVNAAGLTILAEQAIPVAELDSARLDAEITAAEQALAGASGADAQIEAGERLSRLQDLRRASLQ
ncbi:F0F1 ATP synthase subunit epsilon [Salinarimonas soli]|uniref:ATP synthase epsilon chain n=1 Tax=Salinarimonas soli TaxID=1638099 RepID=A0A5B2VCS6_9HYPH|nr:F0F1 ATP synthase subunit epsilon [Salinarimonas soli]KAA2236861.1 F0F1 ATP synthase subunit epsilon [Salinarimonas soli]